MKYYTVKPEYLTLWGENVTEDTIVTAAEVENLAHEWEKPVDELLCQLDEIPMQDAVSDHFIPVSDAEIRQSGAPAEVYMALDAIRDDEEPDEDGCVSLYELIYPADAEEADFDNPTDIRPTGYGWHIVSRRRV